MILVRSESQRQHGLAAQERLESDAACQGCNRFASVNQLERVLFH